MASVNIWDLPTRVFHWALVACVLVGVVTAEEEGILYTLHALAGVGAAALVVFRLAWGIAGNERARFADFVRGAAAVRAYALALLRLSPPHHAGHNPLGGWMVLILLAVVLATAASGMLAGGLAGPDAARAAEEVHEFLGSLLQILVLVHVAGVLVEWLLTGENLIAAMWHGRKPAHVPGERDAAGGPLWLALAIAVPIAVLAGYVVASLPLSPPPESGHERD